MTTALFIALLFLQPPASTAQERLETVRQQARKTDSATVAEMIRLADTDPDPRIRRVIVDRLGRHNRPEIRAMLERRALTDPDAEIATFALERLRLTQAQELGRIFNKRLELAKSGNDEKARAILTAAHQRWASLAKGAILPAYFEQPPPVFQASAKEKVRVLGFGDFGEEGDKQVICAKAVAAYHRDKPFDIGITLGDNIAPVGVTGPADPRWRGGWEELYDPLGIRIYASTGNHDWGLADSPAAEIIYSQKSPSWKMPALYYTYTAGPAQFFALATHAMSETQIQWLDRELSRSTAKWKIVYGHHPIYTYGTHGDSPELERMLLPVLKGRVHAYIAGHDHLVQHLKPIDGVHLFVTPSSGQTARPVKSGEKTLAVDTFDGFMVLDVSPEKLDVTFVDSKGVVRYQTQIQ